MADPNGVMSDRSPHRDSDAFDCPRCHAFAHQGWYVLKREYFNNESGDRWTDDANDSKIPQRFGRVTSSGKSQKSVVPVDAATSPAEVPEPEGNGVWAMSFCGRCSEYSTWRDDRLVYPAGSSFAPEPHADMPAEAATLYREAASVVGISRRAGAALARATLERLLKAVDPMDGRHALAAQIDHVLPHVSGSLGQMLTVIRHVGNKSLHVEENPDDIMVLILDPGQDEIVEFIFAAINDLVDELVTRPARTQAMFIRVPEKIRSQVGLAATDR